MSEITPEEQTSLLWGYVKGFHAVHLVATGTKLGLFARLDAAGAPGIDAAGLAAGLDLHPPYVEVWCQTACAYGLLDAGEAGHFRLAPHMDELLAKGGHPRGLAPYFSAAVDHLGADMARHPEFFRSGDTYTYQEHGAEFSAAIAAITTGFHTVMARAILPKIPGLAERLEAGASLLDMGCGSGGLLIKIAQAFPAAQCTGVDVDAHGIEAAAAAIAAAGLGERVRAQLVDGASFGHAEEFDVVVMFEVLHELPVAVRPRVLANAYGALKPGGVLVVLDETFPSTPEELRDPAFAFAVQTAFNEMTWGNVVPTRQDQEALLAGAGFVDVGRDAIADIFTLIMARKADAA
jgi:SAM-dependent methyltransferase